MSTNHTQVKLGAVFHRTEVLKFTGSSRGKVEREREVGGEQEEGGRSVCEVGAQYASIVMLYLFKICIFNCRVGCEVPNNSSLDILEGSRSRIG